MISPLYYTPILKTEAVHRPHRGKVKASCRPFNCSDGLCNNLRRGCDPGANLSPSKAFSAEQAPVQ